MLAKLGVLGPNCETIPISIFSLPLFIIRRILAVQRSSTFLFFISIWLAVILFMLDFAALSLSPCIKLKIYACTWKCLLEYKINLNLDSFYQLKFLSWLLYLIISLILNCIAAYKLWGWSFVPMPSHWGGFSWPRYWISLTLCNIQFLWICNCVMITWINYCLISWLFGLI